MENSFVIFVIHASPLFYGLELLYTMHSCSQHEHVEHENTHTHGKDFLFGIASDVAVVLLVPEMCLSNVSPIHQVEFVFYFTKKQWPKEKEGPL